MKRLEEKNLILQILTQENVSICLVLGHKKSIIKVEEMQLLLLKEKDILQYHNL